VTAGELLDVIGGQFVNAANVNFFEQSLLVERINGAFLSGDVLNKSKSQTLALSNVNVV
jgi:hypothetical protein